MTRDDLYDLLKTCGWDTDPMQIFDEIWGQPFDGETEKINTTKSVSSTSPATEESSAVSSGGNEADFVTKPMAADKIMAGKMAEDLRQICEQIAALGKYQTNLLGGGGWDILVRMISDAERVDSHLCRRWNIPNQTQPQCTTK